MKNIITVCLVLFAVIATEGSEIDISGAKYLCSSDGMDNYKKCIEVCREILKEAPDNFDLLWKASRACNKYGRAVKEKELKGWRNICRKYGEKGMEFAEKAIELEPDRPEGYFFYGLNIGLYADGVSWFTALRKGLKDKTQESFEKVYEIDKMFCEAEAIVALARFWSVLPWPYKDREKALEYFREYQETSYYKNDYSARLYIAELLLNIECGEKTKEAKVLLEEVVLSGREKQRERALGLMKDVLARSS